jgi:hypothetical protein
MLGSGLWFQWSSAVPVASECGQVKLQKPTFDGVQCVKTRGGKTAL